MIDKKSGITKGLGDINLTLGRKVVSIEISESKIRICEISNNKKHPVVSKSCIINTPANMVEDGYIRDKKGFSEFLKVELKQEGIENNRYIFTINSSKVLSREVVIPLVKDKNIKSVIDAEINQYFPMDISDYVVQFTVVEKLVEQSQMRLMVYAAPNNLIRNYFNLAELIGGNVEALDFKGNSVYQWIHKNEVSNTNLVLQMNETSTLVTITHNGIFQLQRTINYGVSNLIYGLAEGELGGDYDYNHIYQLLKKVDLTSEIPEQIEAYERGEESSLRYLLQEEVAQMLFGFVGNITRVIEYHSSRYKQTPVEQILVLMQGDTITGFEELLRSQLGLPVKKIAQVEEAKNLNKVELEASLTSEFIGCIGAVYAPLDFRLANETKLEETKHFYKLYIGLLVGTAVACGSLILSSHLQYKSTLKEQESLQAQINDLSYLDDLKKEYDEAKMEFEEMQLMHSESFSSNAILRDLIEELEQALPTKTMITSFQSSGEELSLSVMVPDKKTAEKFLLQLKNITYIKEVEITGLTETKNEEFGTTEVTFSVRCVYNLEQIFAQQLVGGIIEGSKEEIKEGSESTNAEIVEDATTNDNQEDASEEEGVEE